MANQLEQARSGVITSEMEAVASAEHLDSQVIADGMAAGHIIITRNNNHAAIAPLGIGKGLRTKINANIGTSKDHYDIEEELQKLAISIEAGADTVMDLSTGGPLDEIRRAILKASTVPIGTVPIYQAGIGAIDRYGAIVKMTIDDLFTTIEEHARDGVDFVTVHCGVTRSAIARLKQQGRVADIVSRGGAFMMGWILVAMYAIINCLRCGRGYF